MHVKVSKPGVQCGKTTHVFAVMFSEFGHLSKWKFGRKAVSFKPIFSLLPRHLPNHTKNNKNIPPSWDLPTERETPGKPQGNQGKTQGNPRETKGKLRETPGKPRENSGKPRENSGKTQKNLGKIQGNQGKNQKKLPVYLRNEGFKALDGHGELFSTGAQQIRLLRVLETVLVGWLV